MHRNYSPNHVAQPLMECDRPQSQLAKELQAFTKLVPTHTCNNMYY